MEELKALIVPLVLMRAAAMVPLTSLKDLHIGKRIEERERSVAAAGESR